MGKINWQKGLQGAENEPQRLIPTPHLFKGIPAYRMEYSDHPKHTRPDAVPHLLTCSDSELSMFPTSKINSAYIYH